MGQVFSQCEVFVKAFFNKDFHLLGIGKKRNGEKPSGFFSPGFACFRPKEPKKKHVFFRWGNGRERVMYVHFMKFSDGFFGWENKRTEKKTS